LQLRNLQERYRSLEISHNQLETAYKKLRESVDLLTSVQCSKDDSKDSGIGNVSTLRSLLEIVYRDVAVKPSS
jgi:AP-1-like transcription factor